MFESTISLLKSKLSFMFVHTQLFEQEAEL